MIQLKILYSQKYKRDDPKPYHEDNPSHKEFFPKDTVVITSRLLSISSSVEATFVKVGANVKFSDKSHTFSDMIPSLGQ